MGPVMRAEQSDLDVVIIGAGPAGIALAAEARAAGVAAGRILILEKAPEHSWIIRKYYPASKPVLANYKGIEAKCEGVLCIPDLTREETLTFLDRAIRESGARVRYGEEVYRIGREPDGRLRIESSGGIITCSRCRHRDRHPRPPEQALPPDSARSPEESSFRRHQRRGPRQRSARRRRWGHGDRVLSVPGAGKQSRDAFVSRRNFDAAKPN